MVGNLKKLFNVKLCMLISLSEKILTDTYPALWTDNHLYFQL